MTALATARGAVSGPTPMRVMDIDAVNRVFSDAFTERYRRDGLAGVRVPQLNPAIWRYAIEGAREGAMVWRDPQGQVVAFNVAHLSGLEGWMGPLAVRPEWQGAGVGKAIVQAGTARLLAAGARVIGLETMPRTVENIGFYSSLGFAPGPLTVTLALVAGGDDRTFALLGERQGRDRDDALRACADLVGALAPGIDFSRELALTLELGIGDVVLLPAADGTLDGFALFHAIPLVEGRPRDEMRVLKLALRDVDSMPRMARALQAVARRAGTSSVAIRVQTGYREAYRQLVASGARVRWTDLRMTLRDHDETLVARGVVFSNWEI